MSASIAMGNNLTSSVAQSHDKTSALGGERPLVIQSVVQERAAIRVTWAKHQDEVRAAQRLRYDVFAGEMGARLTTPIPGHDIDLFDNF